MLTRVHRGLSDSLLLRLIQLPDMVVQYLGVPFAVVMFSAWIFGVVEIASVFCFARWPYMYGKRVIYEPMSTNIPYPLPVGFTGQTANGKYVVQSQDIVLLRRKLRFFEYQNVLPLKSVLRLDHEGITFEARLPIGPLVFVIGWLLAWFAGSLSFIEQDPVTSVLIAAVGSLVVGLMIGISLWSETKRARSLAAEVIMQLSAARA